MHRDTKPRNWLHTYQEKNIKKGNETFRRETIPLQDDPTDEDLEFETRPAYIPRFEGDNDWRARV